MDHQRRRRIEEVFEEALERDADEREAFLVRESAGDADLLDEVRSLLAADRLAERLFGSGEEPPVSERIGPYRVIREIGRGGMGLVYLAERADGQYRRRVAIKLISVTHQADPLHQRFLAERQILAGLDHPHIARLLDGGLTEDGRPYLVLEFVDGLPLTTYCDRHRVTIEDRLRLFVDICDAVHHAHQNLIIHRDLKPGNILVTAAGEVRLLDFGIAKLVNPTLTAAAGPVTRTETRVMTPEYASPEQVRGESLTTVSDVYSLGVLLYELLTGSPPYRLATRSPVEIVRAVCEHDPERPSTRVLRTEPAAGPAEAESDLTPEERGRRRATSAEQLRARLRGDLDSIVLMAMRKEPAGRYSSADLLRQDVLRYLEGQPVAAHRGSRGYRMRKLIRRHRVEAVAAAAVLVSLLGGSGVATWQASVARDALDREQRERGNAERALRQSEAVTEFLVGLFEASDPELARGDSITARELMERGLARAEALDSEPAVQARLFEAVGRVHRSLGEYPRAQELLVRASDLRTRLYGPEHPEVALSNLHLAEVLRRRGQYDSAQILLETALDIQRRMLGADDPALATTLHELSLTAELRGDLAGAERAERESLALRQRTLGTHHPLSAASLVHLGSVLRSRGDYDGAERVLREAMEIRNIGSDRGAGGLAGLLELADMLQLDRGDEKQAEPLYRSALAELRSMPLPEPAAHVRALRGLSRILEDRKELDPAEELLREDIALRRHVYGAEHPFVSAGLLHLAGFFERTERLAEAERLFREVAEIDSRLLGEDHPTYAGTLGAIARTLAAQGRLDEADSLLARVYRIRVERLGPRHPLVGRTYYWQADIQIRRGNHTEADRLLRQALDLAQAQTTGASSGVRDVLEKLAQVNDALGRPGEATRFREMATRTPNETRR